MRPPYSLQRSHEALLQAASSKLHDLKQAAQECIEYLLTRKKRSQERPHFENFSFEHTLSFQRRVHAVKALLGCFEPALLSKCWRLFVEALFGAAAGHS